MAKPIGQEMYGIPLKDLLAPSLLLDDHRCAMKQVPIAIG